MRQGLRESWHETIIRHKQKSKIEEILKTKHLISDPEMYVIAPAISLKNSY